MEKFLFRERCLVQLVLWLVRGLDGRRRLQGYLLPACDIDIFAFTLPTELLDRIALLYPSHS